MSPFEEIAQEDWEALLEGMVRRQYHLLVGAGINSDCISGDGKPIPNANVLANQLITDFGLKTGGEDVDLKRAYENIEDLRDQQGRNRTQYFKARFSNCTPSWQGLIFHLGWRRIWTLNVDDVLENAFDRYVSETKTQRKLNRYTWRDLFAELGRENDDIQIVHLHGFADSTDNFIFSITEYLRAITTKKTWHPVFGDEYQGEPFVIIGAKIRDEIDFSESIRLGSKSRELLGRPSIIVLKEITELQRTEFRKYGLVPVKCDAKTFIERLIPDVISLEAKLAKTVVPGSYPALPFQARVFLEQFRALRTNKEEQITPFGHDFYAGYEPIWADILNEYDVRFEAIDNAYEELVSIIKSDTDQKIYYISGDPGSGKSAILFRIARDLIALGKDVFLFRSEERPSVNSVLWWLKHSPNTILLFDNIADFLGEIGQLCEVCRTEKVRLLIVATERTRREGIIVDELEYNFLQKYKKTPLGYLSDSDINKLIDKLRNQGRLGKITRKFVGEQRDYFRKTSNRQLFPAMADLEGGQGFVRRITKEYQNDIKAQELKHVYALVCISHALGYALPIGIISSTVGIPVNKIAYEVSSGQLFRIVVFDSKGLKARHRVIASNLIEKVFNNKERYELVKNLAIHLSPHISISAIQQKTLYYRIIKELMDERIILDWLDPVLAQKFYSNLLPYYDWNARYWEQRALAEASMNHLDPAMSFAETAVARNRDPFTLNTLGTVLLRTACSPDYSGAAGTLDLYWKGVGNLHESLDIGQGRFPHPYTTFFTHTLGYVQLHFKNKEINRDIIREWEWWYKKAQSSLSFASPDRYAQLTSYNISWLNLVTQGSIEE